MTDDGVAGVSPLMTRTSLVLSFEHRRRCKHSSKSSGDSVMTKASRFVILVSFVQMMNDFCFMYSVTMKVAARKILECSALSGDVEVCIARVFRADDGRPQRRVQRRDAGLGDKDHQCSAVRIIGRVLGAVWRHGDGQDVEVAPSSASVNALYLQRTRSIT